MSASSLKPTVGLASKRRAIASTDGGSPSPSEFTNRTGRGSSDSAAGSDSPAWRSARSSAADSKAQLRQLRARSHSGGCGFHWSSVARCSQKLSSVHSPASSRYGPAASSASWFSANGRMSSPHAHLPARR